MQTYDWEALAEDWEAEKVTMVQVVGQLIVQAKLAATVLRSLDDITIPGLKNQVKTLEKRLTALEERLNTLEKRQKRQD